LARIGDPDNRVRMIDRDENPVQGVVQHASGNDSLFELLNRGKQGVAVNLEDPQRQEIVQKLAAR